MDWLSYIIAAVAGYLVGSIPTGYLVARSKGVDIRSVGSGNMGATNVLRTLGKGAGALVLVVDVVKGFLAGWGVSRLIHAMMGSGGIDPTERLEWLTIISGLSAVLGHNYTCWLNFKGGKGIATSGGVLASMFPAAFGIVVVFWILIIAVTRYVSLASVAAAIALPVTVWALGSTTRMLVVAFILSTLAIYRHRPNIRRLMAGTESRIGQKNPESIST